MCVAAARGSLCTTKLQGSTGASVRAAAQQKLGVTLPPASGQLVIMRSNELKTAQDIANAVKNLAIVLPAIALLLFALAVYLARGRRRRTLRTTGWCFVIVGVALLLIRRVAGDAVVNGLVKVPSNKPAAHQVWDIATSLLFALAVALIAYGIVIVAAAWLAGPTRPATAVRKFFAPSLRDSPGVAYSVAGGLLLLVVLWVRHRRSEISCGSCCSPCYSRTASRCCDARRRSNSPESSTGKRCMISEWRGQRPVRARQRHHHPRRLRRRSANRGWPPLGLPPAVGGSRRSSDWER